MRLREFIIESETVGKKINDLISQLGSTQRVVKVKFYFDVGRRRWQKALPEQLRTIARNLGLKANIDVQAAITKVRLNIAVEGPTDRVQDFLVSIVEDIEDMNQSSSKNSPSMGTKPSGQASQTTPRPLVPPAPKATR